LISSSERKKSINNFFITDEKTSEKRWGNRDEKWEGEKGSRKNLAWALRGLNPALTATAYVVRILSLSSTSFQTTCSRIHYRPLKPINFHKCPLHLIQHTHARAQTRTHPHTHTHPRTCARTQPSGNVEELANVEVEWGYFDTSCFQQYNQYLSLWQMAYILYLVIVIE